MKKGVTTNRNKFHSRAVGQRASRFSQTTSSGNITSKAPMCCLSTPATPTKVCATLIHNRTHGEDGILLHLHEEKPISFNPFFH